MQKTSDLSFSCWHLKCRKHQSGRCQKIRIEIAGDKCENSLSLFSLSPSFSITPSLSLPLSLPASQPANAFGTEKRSGCCGGIWEREKERERKSFRSFLFFRFPVVVSVCAPFYVTVDVHGRRSSFTLQGSMAVAHFWLVLSSDWSRRKQEKTPFENGAKIHLWKIHFIDRH